MSYIKLVNNRVKVKQDLANLLSDIRIAQLEYEGNCMRGAVINAYQFLYFNPTER